MLIPRITFVSRLTAALLASVCFLIIGSTTIIEAQQPSTSIPEDTALGIKLYQQGEIEGAIKILSKVVKKRKDDADAWFYLGLTFDRKGDIKNARKALENAANLRVAHFTNEFIASKDEDYEVRIQQLKSFLKEAVDSLSKYIQIIVDSDEANRQRERMEMLDVYTSYLELAGKVRNGNKVFRGSEVVTKLHLLSRPEPHYPMEALRAGAAGRVVLKAVLAADGTVKYMTVIESPSQELAEASIRAAREIKFVPASVDGHPISSLIEIEYHFSK